MSKRVAELLLACGGTDTIAPPTTLYNEGWLLRLVLDWHDRNRGAGSKHLPAFADGARWYSEALLASRFQAKRNDEKRELAESHTHADGVVGHFHIAPGERGEATLLRDATQLVVIEAKLGSPLSKGTKNAPNYGQAARNVACMAHVLADAKRKPSEFESLAFYVAAPSQQIEAGVFENFVTRESIEAQVRERVAKYAGRHDDWLRDWFLPLLEHITLKVLAWEDLVDQIEERDSGAGLREFYARCLDFNPLRGPH